MAKRTLFKDKEKRKRLVHIMAGVVILIHAFEKYASGHGSPLFFAISGVTFLTIAIFHPALEKRFPWIDGVFFFIEGLLSVAVALDFFHLSKKALPWTYLLLSFFQFFMAFFKSAKGIKHHKVNQVNKQEAIIVDAAKESQTTDDSKPESNSEDVSQDRPLPGI